MQGAFRTQIENYLMVFRSKSFVIVFNAYKNKIQYIFNQYKIAFVWN